MLCANYHKGKCWAGCISIACLPPTTADGGHFLRAIGPCNHVGDIEHASCRILNTIVKQLNETIQSLIEMSAPDVAHATRKAGKALVALAASQNFRLSGKCGPWRALGTTANKGRNVITGGKMFLEDSALHAQVVAALRDKLPKMVLDGVNLFVLVRYVLLSMHQLHALWRNEDWLTQEELKDMEQCCDRLGEEWGKLQWGVTPWVQWAVVHNNHVALPFSRLMCSAVFLRSTGSHRLESISKKPMRSCLLRRPHTTCLGRRHMVHTDAVEVGLQLY